MELSHRHEDTPPSPSYFSNYMDTPRSVGGGDSEITVPGDTPLNGIKEPINAPQEANDWSETAADRAAYRQPLSTTTMAMLEADLSVATLPEIKAARSTAAQVIDYALNEYGSFTSAEAVAASSSYPDRILVVSPDEFAPFCNEWSGIDCEVPGDAAAGHFTYGQLTTIKDPKECWKALPNMTLRIIAHKVGEWGIHSTRIHDAVTEITYNGTLTHEPYHSLQDLTLPQRFSEAGAFYYEARTLKGLRLLEHPIILQNPSMVKQYTKLIKKYGDDVHRLFFGSLDDPKRRAEILDDFTPRVTGKPFPAPRAWHLQTVVDKPR